MNSLKYFSLGLFVFLCLSCSSANRLLLDSLHIGDQDPPLNKPVDDNDNQSPILETGFGFGAGSGIGVGHGVGGGIGIGRGGYGVGIGSGSGYSYWPGPGYGSGCVLGYVCPAQNGRGGCNNFPYGNGNCESFGFYPLTPTDLHEVEIKWGDNKPIVAGEPQPPNPFKPAQNGV